MFLWVSSSPDSRGEVSGGREREEKEEEEEEEEMTEQMRDE